VNHDHNNGYAGEPENTAPTSTDVLPLVPVSWADLDRERPERGPVVIDGILREGSVGTLISSSKARKTWMIMALAVAAASGGQWLGRNVTKGRVLLVDAELTRATLYWRLGQVSQAMGVASSVLADAVDIFDLRGRTQRAREALAWAGQQGPGAYKIIVIDPLSCFYPTDPQFSENSNSDMRRVCDGAITFATATKAAVMIVHHSTKGSQNEKDAVDVGAGAGAVARSVDAHLVLRRHKERDVVVLDGVLRDFPELAASCWRWDFPLYSPALELDPADLAGLRRSRKAGTKEFLAAAKVEDWTPEDLVKHVLSDQGQIIEQIILAGKSHGQGERAIRSLLKVAVSSGIAFKWWERGSNEPARYSRRPPPSPPTHNPPHPPEACEHAPGRGKRARGERGTASKDKPRIDTAGATVGGAL
jgi:hypothetical protein